MNMGAGQLEELELQGAAAFHVPSHPFRDDIVGAAGLDVRHDRDDPLAAQGKQRYDLVVVARIDVDIAQRGHLRRGGDVAVGLFDRHDIWVLRQGGDGFGFDVHPRAGRDVIEQDRQVHRVRHGGVVGHEAALGGFVVVRRHQQQGVRAQFFGLPGRARCSRPCRSSPCPK